VTNNRETKPVDVEFDASAEDAARARLVVEPFNAVRSDRAT
jgi:hypothetical protein